MPATSSGIIGGVTDPIVHDLPMRWADLDSLNHVNNVVYVDYAAESRALLVEDGLVRAGEQPMRVAVSYLRPLLLSRDPVRVASTRDGDELTQAIRPSRSASDFARVVTTLGAEPSLAEPRGTGTTSPLHLRRSDVDGTGAVRSDKMFELIQESRVPALATALTGMQPGRFVAAQVDVDYGRPLRWRRAPLEAVTWVSRVGTSSVTVESQVVDGDEVMVRCRTTLVGFDLPQQRSRRLSDQEKAELATLIPQS